MWGECLQIRSLRVLPFVDVCCVWCHGQEFPTRCTCWFSSKIGRGGALICTDLAKVRSFSFDLSFVSFSASLISVDFGDKDLRPPNFSPTQGILTRSAQSWFFWPFFTVGKCCPKLEKPSSRASTVSAEPTLGVSRGGTIAALQINTCQGWVQRDFSRHNSFGRICLETLAMSCLDEFFTGFLPGSEIWVPRWAAWSASLAASDHYPTFTGFTFSQGVDGITCCFFTVSIGKNLVIWCQVKSAPTLPRPRQADVGSIDVFVYHW